jgi:hypothetical protein
MMKKLGGDEEKNNGGKLERKWIRKVSSEQRATAGAMLVAKANPLFALLPTLDDRGHLRGWAALSQRCGADHTASSFF